MKFNPKKIGAVLKYFRLKNNMRQEDVALKIDISAAYVGMIENGKRVPSLDVYVDLAEAVNAEVDLFMHEKGAVAQWERLEQFAERISKLEVAEQEQLFKMMDIYIQSCEKK